MSSTRQPGPDDYDIDTRGSDRFPIRRTSAPKGWPLQLATYGPRIATGQAAHSAHRPEQGLPALQLDVIPAGLYAVVNET